jgi:hypothetical protein
MYHCQLTRVIELPAGNPLAAGQDRRFGQFPQLPTVDEPTKSGSCDRQNWPRPAPVTNCRKGSCPQTDDVRCSWKLLAVNANQRLPVV